MASPTDLVPGFTSVSGVFTMDVNANGSSINELIHPYWRQWDIENIIPDSWHYGVAIWMTFFGLLGVSGNMLVIWTFLRTKSLRTPPNILLVNLAISDGAFSAINGFPLLTISAINKKWVWGKTWCELYGFAGGIFGFISINTLAWIAYDRYQVISNPLGAAVKMTKKRSFTFIFVIWVWSSLWAVPPLFGWGAYIPEGFQTSCTFDYLTHNMNNYTMVLGMYFFAFIMPVFMIVFCYTGIVSAIKTHGKEMKKTAERMGAKTSKGDDNKTSEIQVAKVAAVTILAFLCSWTPYAVIGALGMMYPYSAMIVTPLMSEIAVMFAKASASYNPVIYALSHPKFRAEVNKQFPWLIVCCKPKPQPFVSRTTKSVGRDSTASEVTETVEMSQSPTTICAPGANPAATT